MPVGIESVTDVQSKPRIPACFAPSFRAILPSLTKRLRIKIEMINLSAEMKIATGFCAFSHINPLLCEIVQAAQDQFDRRAQETPTIPTGIPEFDRQYGELRRGDLILITGDAGSGKRTFALDTARHIATKLLLPVCVFSAKILGSEIVLRILTAQSYLERSRIRSGDLNDKDWWQMSQALGALHEAPILINDCKDMSFAKVRQILNQERPRSADPGLVFIDSVQLLAGRRTNQSRNDFLRESFGHLKSLAQEINTPIIVTAPLRAVRFPRKNKERPASLYAHVDVVLLMKHNQGLREPVSNNMQRVDITVRNLAGGRSEVGKLMFRKRCSTFS